MLARDSFIAAAHTQDWRSWRGMADGPISVEPMKWLAERLICSWGLSLLLASGASAQAVGQTIVQPDDVPDAQRHTNQPWSLGLGVSELSEADSQPGISANNGTIGSEFTGTLARNWTLNRGTVTLNGNANQFFYGQGSSLNQLFYGVGVTGSYVVSPRLSYNVSDTLSSSYAQDVTTLTDSGLLPPKILTHINVASTGLSYDLSPRTHVRWGFTEQDVSVAPSQFAAASTLGTSFAGASTLGTSISVTRQLDRSETLGVTASYSRADATGAGTAENIGLFGTWQRTITKDVTVNAAGGTQQYTLPGQLDFRTSPAGSLGFTAHLRGSNTLGLHYERSIEQNLGNGTLLTQGVVANYGLSLGLRLSLAGGAGYLRGTDPLDSSHLLIGQTGNMSVRYVLMPNLAIVLNYSLYVLTNAPAATASSRRATMSLTYGLKWGS
jgi:hypothetical protein